MKINYGNMDLTDAVFNELAFFDTNVDEGNVAQGFGDGVLNDEELANLGGFDAASGLQELRDILKPYGYRLLQSEQDDLSTDAEESVYEVQPEMDCPEGQRYIPTSIFAMGSKDGSSDEQPVHDVEVSGFCASETETTNAQFNAFVESLPEPKQPSTRVVATQVCTTVTTTQEVIATTTEDAKAKAKRAAIDATQTKCEIKTADHTPTSKKVQNNSPFSFDAADQPVVIVDWKTATAYCDSRPDLNGEPMRLPTEAEQEIMLRDPLDGVISHATANYDSNGTQAVGRYPQDGWGLYDVHGNVWEWGADWYGKFSAEFQIDPTGPTEGDYRILRGGSWRNNDSLMRSSDRNGLNPAFRDSGIGFRCVSSPRTPEE